MILKHTRHLMMSEQTMCFGFVLAMHLNSPSNSQQFHRLSSFYFYKQDEDYNMLFTTSRVDPLLAMIKL
jgi:hypothetical protein